MNKTLSQSPQDLAAPKSETDTSARRSSPNQVLSLGKMLRILECYSRQDRALSVLQIAERTGIPRPTVHRLVASLRTIGFIEQDRDRERYRLGLKLFELGNVVLANMDLQREAQEHIDALARGTGLGVHLGVFDGFEIVMVSRTQRDHVQLNNIVTLESASLHSSATGKATLAFQDEHVIERVISQGLRGYTRATITTPAQLREELRHVRQRGYATDHGESEDWRYCVAAPIRNSSGRVFASISLTGIHKEEALRDEARYAQLVQQHADDISRKLGHIGEA